MIRGTSRLFESSTHGVILAATTLSSNTTTLVGIGERVDVAFTDAEGSGGGGGGGGGGGRVGEPAATFEDADSEVY